MRVFTLALAFVFSLFTGSFVHAEITTDPSGHWEGTITTPMGDLRFEIDLARATDGSISGTFSQPDQKVVGLPMASVSIVGGVLTIAVKVNHSVMLRGALSADGHALSGKISAPEGEAPFTMVRTGQARAYPAPKSHPITQELEGTWRGTLDVRGGLRVEVRLHNEADGTAAGEMVSVDESQLIMPIEIRQQGADVRLEVPTINSHYQGRLTPDRSELAGTYTTNEGAVLSLTLRRASK